MPVKIRARGAIEHPVEHASFDHLPPKSWRLSGLPQTASVDPSWSLSFAFGTAPPAP